MTTADPHDYTTIMRHTLPRRLISRLGEWSLDTALDYALRGKSWRTRDVEIRVRLVRGEAKAYAQRVANALGLIARHDPLRLARIQRDVGVILVSALVTPGAVAQYNRRRSVCMLDGAAVLGAPVPLLALWIVHEATHARLAAVTPTRENIARIERICTAQELAFTQRLPGSEQLQAALQKSVVQASEIDYSHAGRAARGLAALEQEGASRAILAVLRRFARYTGDR